MSKVRVFTTDGDEILGFHKFERVLFRYHGEWEIDEDGNMEWAYSGDSEPLYECDNLPETDKKGQEIYCDEDGEEYTEAELTFRVCEHDSDEDEPCEECGAEVSQLTLKKTKKRKKVTS